MKMKKISLILAMAVLSAAAFAQTTEEEYAARYLRQANKVGEAGVGVETIIDRWEEAFPESIDAKVARVNYYIAKSKTTTMAAKPGLQRYLGNKPLLTLKDSLGVDVNYFEEPVFNDEYFSQALTLIDECMAASPDEARYRFVKINALREYEKEDPTLAEAEMNKLIDARSSGLKFDGKPIPEDELVDIIQEFCGSFYTIGSPAAYEAFLRLSQKMNKLYPKRTEFIDNIGSYYLVAAENPKKALSYYKKALKLNPEDVVAIRNSKLATRKLQGK